MLTAARTPSTVEVVEVLIRGFLDADRRGDLATLNSARATVVATRIGPALARDPRIRRAVAELVAVADGPRPVVEGLRPVASSLDACMGRIRDRIGTAG